VIVRAELDRRRASEDRACAAADRAVAAEHRDQAARDREQAARDRRAAVAEQQLTGSDALPGVLSCQPGLQALAREVDRAHRTDSALTVLVIGDDHGDAVDARDGRAGDALQDIVGAVLSRVRSYDLVISSGDTIVAGLGVPISDARARGGLIEHALAQAVITISVGYAELDARDTTGTLLDRAHADRATPRTPPVDIRRAMQAQNPRP
jgi:hypothetical protein